MVSLAEGVLPRQALRMVEQQLREAGVPDAGFDARELYRLAVGSDPRLARSPLTGAQARRLGELAARRAAREPLQYLCGQWDFLDFTLKVGPGVLCPRADTEVVCEAALDTLKGNPAPAVLDLCAGTGCLGLGVKRFCPGAAVVCVEKSPAAFAYLAYNAAHALPGYSEACPAVQAVQGDLFGYEAALCPGSLDLILCNPPYLTAREMANLMPETAREPAMALDGGADGLNFYRYLVRHYAAALRPGGAMVLEVGWQQGAAVAALGRAAGWGGITCRRDYGGNDRAVTLCRR